MARMNRSFGELAEGHFGGGIGHPEFVEERVGETIIEGQRDADEDRRDKKDEIGFTFEQDEGFFARAPSIRRLLGAYWAE